MEVSMSGKQVMWVLGVHVEFMKTPKDQATKKRTLSLEKKVSRLSNHIYSLSFSI